MPWAKGVFWESTSGVTCVHESQTLLLFLLMSEKQPRVTYEAGNGDPQHKGTALRKVHWRSWAFDTPVHMYVIQLYLQYISPQIILLYWMFLKLVLPISSRN